MIRLKHILSEITLGGIQPYATQFVWQRHSLSDSARIATFSADGIQVELVAMQTDDAETSDWDFAIVMPTHDGEGRTVAHSRSIATGQINYLRLMSTAAEALLDFVSQWQPDSVNVSASDTSNSAKESQKAKIYRNFLAANASRISAAGYRVLDTGRELYLVRK